MAAEDYIDFFDYDALTDFDDHPFFQNRKASFQNKDKNKDTKKNKEIEWVTGQGEVIRVADMEDSHLGNTIRYIVRKMDEHEFAIDVMRERGFTVPPYVINKRPGTEWLEILGKEANRRKKKEIEKAQKVLSSN